MRIYNVARPGVLLAAGLCLSALMSGASSVSAEPIEKTYSPTACFPANVTEATSKLWSKDQRGFENAGRRSLLVECPVLKDNIGASVTRAFVWVQNTDPRESVSCTIRSIRIDGGSNAFFSSVFTAEVDRPVKLEFDVGRIPDTSFPIIGDVVRPSGYTVGCALAARGDTLLAYHVQEDG